MATTLELACAIADAVWRADVTKRDRDSLQDRPTQAVLRTLREHGSWFCRLQDTPQGTVETPYEQQELFG